MQRMNVSAVNLMFRAFSDRTRLRILHLLSSAGELCVGDLVAVLRVPQPTASRNLAYLRRAGLVTVRREGLWKHYSLSPAKTGFQRSLLACLSGCFRDVPELHSDLKRYRATKKGSSCCP
jgi:ArsR family transcriptional regulator